ncbi:MAG: glycosyltransferase family 2 protein [Thermoanaerobaculales bacterium]
MRAPLAPAARVGVVVVHFGDPTPTLACLRALRDDPSVSERAVVVVDNSGTLPASFLPGEVALPCPDNPGFGAGVNRGVLALGEGPFGALVILNNDVEIAPGYLAAALGALHDPAVGAAAGPLYLDRIGGRLWYAGGGVNFLTGTVRQSTSGVDAVRARRVGFIPGAALAVHPAVWREVGGFNTAYLLYNEDLDLCLRLRRRAIALRFVPEMAAVHRVGASTGSAARSPLYLEYTAANRLRPFRPLAFRLYLALIHTGYVGLRALWHRVARGGVAGRQAARALLRGHARALGGIRRGPSEACSDRVVDSRRKRANANP